MQFPLVQRDKVWCVVCSCQSLTQDQETHKQATSSMWYMSVLGAMTCFCHFQMCFNMICVVFVNLYFHFGGFEDSIRSSFRL